MDALLRPERLWTRSEILSANCVPRLPGVYAWYFRETPPGVPVDGCVLRDGLTLLYAGISPKAPPRDGSRASSQTLRSRLRQHLKGNASVSTLRLTLGCLLSKSLSIELRRVGARLTFAAGEATLSEWMEQNAFVCWSVTDEPWKAEEEMIRSVCLPLNLDQNKNHPFHAVLTQRRAAARRQARELAVLRPRRPPPLPGAPTLSLRRPEGRE